MFLPYYKVVDSLRSEYWYSPDVCYASRAELFKRSHGSIKNRGFMGSSICLELQSKQDMDHHWGACVAAPFVTCEAEAAMYLGVHGSSLDEQPLRIYAPDELLLEAGHIFVGDMQFVTPVADGEIRCRTITFCREGEEDPATFEIVKQWLSERHPPEIIYRPLDRRRVSSID